MRSTRNLFTRYAFVMVMLWGAAQPLSAHPNLLANFQKDPLRKSDVDGCNVCHVNPKGGGTRNEFGMAYEDAGATFTPMLRANYPDRFAVPTTKLADGSVFYFSDPKGQFVVYERDKKKFLFDMAALTAPKKEAPAPKINRMSFFVTSKGPGNGGHLEGLAGADRYCQSLAESAGIVDRTWRAYLSTSFEGLPTVHAGDRIGTGPWFNARGVLVARGVADLHSMKNLAPEIALNEKAESVVGDVLTGSNPDGTAAIGMDCDNWTSPDDGKAMAGQIGQDGKKGSWISAHTVNGCSQKTFQASGGEGRFYCFAIK